MPRALAAALVALWTSALAPPGADAATGGREGVAPLVLAGARVLDERGEAWLDDRDVVLDGGRIVAIAAGGKAQAPVGARRIDLAGLHLIPGLIDLHTHLLLHPYDEAPWDDQVLRESLELRTLRAGSAARATLVAGFTTIRDLGTEGAGFADVALRDAIAAGIISGPRLFPTTRAIVALASYGPAGFDPRWDVPQGAQEAHGPEGARRAVREQAAAGADWIKVYADYSRRPGAHATPTFTLEELQALVDEASSADLPVAAHATTDEGIRRAVTAGVRTIEHGDAASEKTLTLMRDKGVALCPTLAAWEAVEKYAGWSSGDAEPVRVRNARALMKRALASGVTIACGSDAGVFAHGDNARELELMVDYGMTPAQALRSATSVAAQVLGRGEALGRLVPGYLADLVAVRDDPLKSISALRHPDLVIVGGRVALGGD